MAKFEKITGKSIPSTVSGFTPEFGERLAEAIGRIGTLGEAGKVAGVTDEQLARWRDGMSKPNFFGMSQLAKAAGLSITWLAEGEGPKMALDAAREPANAIIVGDTVDIPRLSIRASAGAGASGDIGEVIDFMPFPTAWLKAKGLNPAAMRIVDVAGDSMEPTLSDGDIIMVDTSVKRIRKDALYVIVRDDEVFVKRGQRRLNGSVLITSDNERYPPEEFSEADADRLRVAGRVAWYGRSI